MRDIGKGGRTVIVSGVMRGAHCTAIAVHRRWSSHIADLRQAYRSIAAIIQTTSEKTGQTEQLQIMSVHVLSAVGRSPEEVTSAIMAWAELLAGGRTTASITGMDANFALCDALPRHVGAALHISAPRGASTRTRPSRARCMASSRLTT